MGVPNIFMWKFQIYQWALIHSRLFQDVRCFIPNDTPMPPDPNQSNGEVVGESDLEEVPNFED